jgi:TonB family protein
MLRIGDNIGPYTLTGKIGRGSFGGVWLAERRTAITTTKVALKLPLDDDLDLESIKQEADLWVQASGHPNILPIIEANIYDDIAVIASEYAPDGSLDAWLKQYSTSPPIEVAFHIMDGILAGLEHLHERRIIHRDLKPANILLQGQNPRLADFGISRVMKTTSQSNNVAGTPAYMAPEAFDGKRNEQTDLWAAAVIFYQLLTGRLPFPQKDVMSLMNSILLRKADPLVPPVPNALQGFFEVALHKEPVQRFRSAAHMRQVLRVTAREIQKSKGINAFPVFNHAGKDNESTVINSRGGKETGVWQNADTSNDALSGAPNQYNPLTFPAPRPATEFEYANRPKPDVTILQNVKDTLDLQPNPYGTINAGYRPPMTMLQPARNSNLMVWMITGGFLIFFIGICLVGLLLFPGKSNSAYPPEPPESAIGRGAPYPPRPPAVVVPGGVPGGIPAGVPPDTPGGVPDFEPGSANSVVIRKSGGVLAGSATRRVEPAYPPLAKAARVSGAVVVEVTVDESGNVINARPLSGHPLLKDSAVAAARGWQFTPTKLSGQPVRVVGTITFNYNL